MPLPGQKAYGVPDAREADAPPPDGTRLAFTSDRDGQIDVYVTAADGSAPRRLTTDPGGDSSPTWSPDGRRLAFERGTGRDETSKDIWTMTATGAAQRRLTTTPGVDAGPSWSPDGRQIAFTSGRDGNHEIYRMRADGTRQKPTVRRPALDPSPDWQAVGSPGATVPAVVERLSAVVDDLVGAWSGPDARRARSPRALRVTPPDASRPVVGRAMTRDLPPLGIARPREGGGGRG